MTIVPRRLTAPVLQLADGLPRSKRILMAALVARDIDFHPVGQRIDDRGADAVQAAGRVVDLAAELSAGMQRGHDHFERRLVLEFRMRVDRNAAAVVADREHVVRLAARSRCGWHGPRPLRPWRCRGFRRPDDAARARRCRRYTCRGGGGRAPAPPEPRCPWRCSPWRRLRRCRKDLGALAMSMDRAELRIRR